MNYPKFKTFQILVPMLKAYNIRHIVISPGSRMREFVLAVEEDPFFITYDVTDERSASYFALGLSQELREPVVIVCTSSTATTNYFPGVTEAFYQDVPIVVLTGDRDPYMLGQQEDQMINQVGMYDRVVRKSVTLPIVKDDNADKWYCERLICEALLELNHHKTGPVHINVPVPAVIYWSNDKPIEEYPEVKVIRRYTLEDEQLLTKKIEELSRANKIFILAGQGVTGFDEKLLDAFFDKYNCVIHAEHMGNISSKGKINIAALSENIADNVFEEYMPDIVISFQGTIAITRGLKEKLRTKKFSHWLIDEEGKVIDAYKNLTSIFECTPRAFFEYFVTHAPKGKKNDMVYYDKWLNKYNKIKNLNVKYSNVFVIQHFLAKMPANSILHLSILNSIRISHYFELPQGTKVYANVGTDGIDGCLSSFFGQSVASDKECFIIIGDLSFFYDMSSLRIKHIKPNAHILLINNHGGNEFYLQPIMPTTPQGLGASHHNSAQGWAQSLGYKYIKATNEKEFLKNIDEFVSKRSDNPILFEVFTDQMDDREAVYATRTFYRELFDKNAEIKKAIKGVVGESTIKGIKSLLGKK